MSVNLTIFQIMACHLAGSKPLYGILLIAPLGTNFSEGFIEIHTFSLKKMYLKMAAILSLPQCVDSGRISQIQPAVFFILVGLYDGCINWYTSSFCPCAWYHWKYPCYYIVDFSRVESIQCKLSKTHWYFKAFNIHLSYQMWLIQSFISLLS